ncbi:MAG TPA: TylF/MycF/NovP-related O-methyltransferase [Pirellulales bacterium]|nr:TylF/MycF/NovP-related O-methyltransferase [Pirellulales bacterium]
MKIAGALSMGGLAVAEAHARLMEDVVKRGVLGDVVEVGVYRGGSACAFAAGFGNLARRLWLYDSFAGMSQTSEKDGAEAAKFVGACAASEDQVGEALERIGIPKTGYVIRKGWIADTLPVDPPPVIALLHIDVDWYENVLLTLEHLYDRVSTGGVIILDDFGHWEGCREAFYDFCTRRSLRPLLERFGHSQAYWIKEKCHNRDEWIDLADV